MRWLAVTALLLIAGCGKAQNMQAKHSEKLDTFDVAEGARPPAARSPVPAPVLAYTYEVTYAVSGRDIAPMQDRQIALCRDLGPARCQLLKTSRNAADPGDDDAYISDQTLMLVDARAAAAFNRRLDAIAAAADATVEHRGVEAEDVGKQVIDIDARLAAKRALAGRLAGIIRTGNGKVGELVEAERAFAAVQEELEAAAGELAALRQRVAMSRVTIIYSRAPHVGGYAPVRCSLRTAGATLATSLAALVTVAVAAAPWAAILAVVVAMRRRFGWRWPLRRRAPRAPTPIA